MSLKRRFAQQDEVGRFGVYEVTGPAHRTAQTHGPDTRRGLGGLRSGTLPTPLCVGFGEACRILASERVGDVIRMRVLHDRFLAELLKTVPELKVNGNQVVRHPGNLNLLFPSIDASLLLQHLHPNVAASTGSACTSGQPEPSHVLRAIGLSPNDANASIRFSIGRFTTEDEVDEAALHVSEACRSLLITGEA